MDNRRGPHRVKKMKCNNTDDVIYNNKAVSGGEVEVTIIIVSYNPLAIILDTI